jgi:hypothetical protein
LAAAVTAALMTAAAAPSNAASDADRARPKLTLTRTSSGTIVAGTPVQFSGTAAKSLRGSKVALQRRVGAGKRAKWVTLTRRKVNSTGTFKVAAKASGGGKNYWRVSTKTKRGQRVYSSPVSTAVYQWYYLSDLDHVEADRFGNGSAEIGGHNFSRSVMNAWDFWWEHEPYGEWNLGYKCVTFTASIGLTDNSTSAGKVEFRATTDGQETSYGTKSIGPATPLTLPVKGILRLRLTDVYVEGPTGSGDGSFWGAWGDAKILCSAKP